MELKITTLIENMQSDDEILMYEHGLSLFIEFEGKKILFDTGQTGNYIQNASRLGKPISDVDYMLISHGHYDHAGGVLKTIPLFTEKKKMYVGDGFFVPKYKILDNGEYKYNGIEFSAEDIHNKIELNCVTENMTYISDKIIIFKNFTRSNNYEMLNHKFFIKVDDKMILDEFTDEIALGLVTSKGLVIIVGCSHVGIINILSTITDRINMPIYAVLGGTHLVEADINRLEKTLDAIEKFKVQNIAVSHCTGETGINFLKENCKQNFILNKTGTIINI